jgi:hypothetical protein
VGRSSDRAIRGVIPSNTVAPLIRSGSTRPPRSRSRRARVDSGRLRCALRRGLDQAWEIVGGGQAVADEQDSPRRGDVGLRGEDAATGDQREQREMAQDYLPLLVRGVALAGPPL